MVEDQQGLRGQTAVFAGAKRQHLYARPPRDVGRLATQAAYRVAEAGAVHVGGHAMMPRGFGNGPGFLRPVHRP